MIFKINKESRIKKIIKIVLDYFIIKPPEMTLEDYMRYEHNIPNRQVYFDWSINELKEIPSHPKETSIFSKKNSSLKNISSSLSIDSLDESNESQLLELQQH